MRAGHIKPLPEVPPCIDLSNIKKSGRPNPASTFRKCSWPVAHFCASAQLLFDSTVQDEQWLLSLLRLVKEGIAIEKKCEAWSDSTCAFSESSGWRYKTCRPRSAAEDQKYPFTSPLYHDTYVAFVWNNFRATRLRLHKVLLRCITLILSHLIAQSLPLHLELEITRKESRAVVAEMVFDVCCSPDFCVGQIDSRGEVRRERPMPHWGYQAFWPLYVAMVSAETGSESERWLRGELEFIRGEMGIECAGMLTRREKRELWDIRCGNRRI
jgi:hypothetical protein